MKMTTKEPKKMLIHNYTILKFSFIFTVPSFEKNIFLLSEVSQTQQRLFGSASAVKRSENA